MEIATLPDLPEQLKAARTKVNWTKRRLATELGVSAQTVANWEDGTHGPEGHGEAVYRIWDWIRRVQAGEVARLVRVRSPKAYGVIRREATGPEDARRLAFANKLKEVRQARSWTQTELARHLGCTVWAVRHWEKGENTPRATTYVRKLNLLLQEFARTMEESGALEGVA